MHVILVEPAFPANQRQFARGLREAGAVVTGIGERPKEYLDPELCGWLDHYEQVGSVCDVNAMTRAVKRVQAMGWVHRIEATVEAHILTTAHVREATGIPGQSVKNALLCRDKPEMKAFLRKNGIPCAASTAATGFAEAKDFAETIGYPLIVKPRAGAGAEGTYKVLSHKDLEKVMERYGDTSVALEEFIEGHEGFYDTLTVQGKVSMEFISHYYPGVLQAMRTRTVSPTIVSTNRTGADSYNELKQMGRRVIQALQLDTCATHMEWFFGPKGLKFSEIGSRPPGVCHWDVYNYGNDIDLYREWANGLVHGRVMSSPSRRFASGIVNLRPNQSGHIVGYTGMDRAQKRYGKWIIDAHLPAEKTPTQPVEAGYRANAWIRVRHPDYDTLREILTDLGDSIQVHAR